MSNDALYFARPDFYVTVADTAQECRRMIIEGEVDPLTVYINLRRMAKIAEKISEDKAVKEAVLAAISQYPRSEVEFSDCIAKEKESSIKYDYSECGDSRLNELYRIHDDIKAEIKSRETFLRNLPGRTDILDDETGEVLSVIPPTRTSKTTIEVTFKK